MDINYLRKKEVSTDELLRYVRFNLSVELGETELYDLRAGPASLTPAIAEWLEIVAPREA